MTDTTKPLLIVILGATAVGKTALALAIAKKFNCEIISADSRQFYRELTIGTAKPSKEELALVPHHLIDMLSISEDYTAGKFENDAVRVIDQILETGKIPIMVGGSGLYVKAVLEGLDSLPSNPNLRTEIEDFYEREGLEALQNRLKAVDPVYLSQIDQHNHVRLIRAIEILELSKVKMKDLLRDSAKRRNFSPLIIGLEKPRPILYKTIDKRVDAMMKAGLEAEAKNVIAFKDNQALQTVGYKELFAYFDGEYNLKRAVELIKRNTRHYAKRQMTWLRKVDDINWFTPADQDKIIDLIKSELKTRRQKNKTVD
ncbi:tRNA (adenosine(37)-N6)-dimethylallyltransferase MiaA [Cryomorpha ignava]|uniref:tRNA dimethylallyltransferase n=1 Tax=Cryomorpha ignava TaxID=101383 RepID=A0A7K3WQV6_9FLAO|nr:tRNA (adenosine(37)-N6)-dimethylallyltransferase MiaA [Cryomorpha ignava]NEN24069.1 tRNA (adenosine(37)-N6)-dimethylallyltransferase MiaA [Cryomorpha ignava]